jgi:ABC-2 type transport system permease protein
MKPSASDTPRVEPSSQPTRKRDVVLSTPPSWRVVWLVTALALRRMTNQTTSAAAPRSARTATAGKSKARRLVFLVLSVFALLWGVIQSTALVHVLAVVVERQANRGLELVDQQALQALRYIEDYQRNVLPEAQNAESWKTSLAYVTEGYVKREGVRDTAETDRRKAELMRVFEERGTAGFRASRLSAIEVFPSSASWYSDAHSQPMLAPLGIITTLLMLVIVLAKSTAANQEIAKAESRLAWWFTFPVAARGLFLAIVLETAIVNPLSWLLAFPFFMVVFWCAGYGWLGIPLGAGATLYVGLLAGSLRVAMETGLRRFLSFRAAARVKAFAAVLIAVLSFAVIAALLSGNWLDTFVRLATRLPLSAVVHPLLPIGIAGGGAQAWSTVAGCTLLAVLATVSATRFAAWTVRDGLTDGTGLYQGQHLRARSKRAVPLGPVLITELCRLIRDRSLVAQIFVLPAAALGLQLLLSPRLWTNPETRARNAGVLAFYVAYLVISGGAYNALAADAPAVWMHFTFPRSISRTFAQKAALWSGIAAMLALASFILVTGVESRALYTGAPSLVLVVFGVVIMAFVATSMGALATDVLAPVPARRARGGFSLFLLGGMFASCIYSPAVWPKLVAVVLYSLLAYGLWQRFHDRAPFLLESTEVPPRDLAVTDGIIAALAFFALQDLLRWLGSILQLAPAQSLLWAFAGAGVVVGSAALLVLWQSGLPEMETALGLRLPRRVFAGVVAGMTAGLCTGLLAWGYLTIIDRVEVLRLLRDEAFPLISVSTVAHTTTWLVLSVFLAPLFEEFVFRGVLYGGFRRSLGPWRAAAASALVFAIIHPPLACIPVFVMGFVGALLYERSRSLLVPVATHMAYNGVILGLMVQ